MFIEWSDIGTYHIEQMRENEDAIEAVMDGTCAAIALCDGVSTCQNSKAGAKVACESLCGLFLKKGSKLEKYDYQTIAQKTVSHIIYDLKKHAKKSGDTLESFSSTAACVLYDRETKKILCINIGDSLVGGISDKGFEILINPQKCINGCYVTTTKGVEHIAEVQILEAQKYRSIFICSDGMWKQFYKNGEVNKDIKEYFDKNDFPQIIKILKDYRGVDDRSIVVMSI